MLVAAAEEAAWGLPGEQPNGNRKTKNGMKFLIQSRAQRVEVWVKVMGQFVVELKKLVDLKMNHASLAAGRTSIPKGADEEPANRVHLK